VFKKLASSYSDSFKGLSKEVWWLALITLINRAGTMVVPFLSLYLKESKGFTLGEVGWIMTAFGVGSVFGSWIGGFLNDRVGSYPTMVFSLLSSGILFIVLQYMDSFWGIAIAIFFVLLCADIFRPAMYVALRAYSKPENQTRSLTLIRLAINLGFAAGPAIGGLLIYKVGYGSLFWVDGLTCIAAVFLMLRVLNPRRTVQRKEEVNDSPALVYSDWKYILFCFGTMLFGVIFFQYFSTVPVYFSMEFKLSEGYIGLLLGFNGLLVFLFEMPIIQAIEKKQGSFLILIALPSLFWLWVVILFMSLSEMLFFPFSNAYAMERAKRGKMGQYMALYSISFSVAHIIGHNSGLHLTQAFGFSFTWWVLIGIAVLGILVFSIIRYVDKQLARNNV
jgi:predicted MFS family arabinose efflux permease